MAAGGKREAGWWIAAAEGGRSRLTSGLGEAVECGPEGGEGGRFGRCNTLHDAVGRPSGSWLPRHLALRVPHAPHLVC